MEEDIATLQMETYVMLIRARQYINATILSVSTQRLLMINRITSQ